MNITHININVIAALKDAAIGNFKCFHQRLHTESEYPPTNSQQKIYMNTKHHLTFCSMQMHLFLLVNIMF